ncbi:MAG: RNA polymerase factor sigma-54 [Planctomycetales bacterium]|nr:RNA polymerase factor sigma-54 [Planctomycetales bacterium]
MRLSFGQEMRQVQKQILAPRMIQSMEILQLPIQALEERIEQELQENPILEMREEDPDLPEEDGQREDSDAKTSEEKELVVDETKNNADDFERLENLGDDWSPDYDERPRMSSNRMAEEDDRRHDAIANMESKPQTLSDYLIEQLGWYELDEPTRQMAERIIYNLDKNGYLSGRLEDLVDLSLGSGEIALAQKALGIIQKLDPPGVGARNLKECLLLQISPGLHLYEQMRVLIQNHLEDLEHNRLPAIQKKTGYSLELIHETMHELRKLNPKPGATFSDVHAPTVTPDVFLDVDEHGVYKIRLEDGRVPSLRISGYYRKMLERGVTDQEKEWIKRKLNAAQWLIESIEQRRNTLTRVAQAIVDHQTAFLMKGPESLEPLKMQQIADKVGVHVTTVSRAVDDKWIQTPRGIFPLKRFFAGGTTSASGEEVAWDTVRLKLQEVIDKEDKQHPLSDDDLVTELGKHGLTVARRTVTKYRKIMKIPSSRERRVWTE